MCYVCYLLFVMCFICDVCVMCLVFSVCCLQYLHRLKSPYLKCLLYFKNVLVVSDSDQLTLNHCPPIHLHCPDCFCQGSGDAQWFVR